MMESDTLTNYGDNSQHRPVKRRARMALSCQRLVLKMYSGCWLNNKPVFSIDVESIVPSVLAQDLPVNSALAQA